MQPSRSGLLAVACVASFVTLKPGHAQSAEAPHKERLVASVRAAAETRNVPADVADALVATLSAYRPGAVGRFGEVGLMQISPATAMMLGHKDGLTALFEPEVNIRLGMTHLATAWRLANGDLCRAVLKYRLGYAEEQATPAAAEECARVKDRLAGSGSPQPAAALPRAPAPPVAPVAAAKPAPIVQPQTPPTPAVASDGPVVARPAMQPPQRPAQAPVAQSEVRRPAASPARSAKAKPRKRRWDDPTPEMSGLISARERLEETRTRIGQPGAPSPLALPGGATNVGTSGIQR